MDDKEKEELLKIDPMRSGTGHCTCMVSSTVESSPTHSVQEALRAFMPPLRSDDDPRMDFYMIYKRDTMEYDANFVKKVRRHEMYQ